jgi:putative hemolysin
MENLLQTAVTGTELEAQLANMRARALAPWVKIKVETSQYVAKTVDQLNELEQALLLRSKIFRDEFGADLGNSAYDLDHYDFVADHLIIISKDTQTVVGTYRLLCSSFTDRFYSESEFEMSHFLATPGTKLELGRACVHADHRRGAVLNLLWRAVVQYAFQVKAKYLFGCSSIQTTSQLETEGLIDQLRTQGAITQEWNIEAQLKYQFQPKDLAEERNSGSTPHPMTLPPLFRSYLKAGAKVVAAPAVDRDFKCVDLLTILKLSDLNPVHESRYKAES